jgi:hypothetical protein
MSAIQTKLTNLKEEKVLLFATIKKQAKELKDTTHMHSTLLSYSFSTMGKALAFNAQSIVHQDYRTIEPLVLIV